MAAGRSAVLAGASGLVGSHLLRRLLAHPDYARVTVWVRRPIAVRDPKLVQAVVDFERLQQAATGLEASDVFVALGTTIKKAGSREAFYRVDYNYPFQVAYLSQQCGAQRFLMVSALDASPRSRVFYSRVKGEAEEAIAALGLPRVWFFRPSLLLGERAEVRRAERIARAAGRLVAPLLIGGLRRYRPIEADAVAAAMVHVATHDAPPPGAIESDAIARLAAA